MAASAASDRRAVQHAHRHGLVAAQQEDGVDLGAKVTEVCLVFGIIPHEDGRQRHVTGHASGRCRTQRQLNHLPAALGAYQVLFTLP